MNTSIRRGVSLLSGQVAMWADGMRRFANAAGQRGGGMRPRSRCLRVEHLEGRQLLASDLTAGALSSIRQNPRNPYDVDLSGQVTAVDALLIANHLHGHPTANVALDVTGDVRVSVEDFAAEIRYLNGSAGGAASAASATPLRQLDSGGPAGAAQGGGSTKPTYQYWIAGNSADRVVNLDSGGLALALVGGGTDVEEVFRRMGARAKGGDFLVLEASGNGIYDQYIKHLAPSLDSVATLLIPDATSANDPFVVQTIENAEAIFIAGGDQSKYINFWSNTGVESAIYDALARHVPIGGTSAGLAVLGDYDFSATVDTITSPEALSNPYDPRVTLDGGFVNERNFTADHPGSSPLGLLTNTITDSHFRQRDRLGRLVTFMARLDADGLVPDAAPRGIGINEQTALLVDADGSASVIGNAYVKNLAESQQQRSVYFLGATTAAPNSLSSPLSYPNVQVVRATYDPKTGIGDTFNLLSWAGTGVDSYSVSATGGGLTSTQPGGLIY